MKDQSEERLLYFKSPADSQEPIMKIEPGISYYVFKSDGKLAVSETRQIGIVGLLYLYQPYEYTPDRKRMSFTAFAGGAAIQYLPTFPGSGNVSDPTLLSEVRFDANQRILIYNKKNTEETLDFKVSDSSSP